MYAIRSYYEILSGAFEDSCIFGVVEHEGGPVAAAHARRAHLDMRLR